MAMMAKMRSLAPAFIITVGALFVLFMIISDSNVLEALGGRSNTVGSVNGVDITYQEFQNMVDMQRENQKAQTGQDIDEEMMDQFRDQVWDAVVSQTLVQQQIEKFGITVSDEEIKNIILGPNPPEFLRQNFIDSLGNFNRQAYEGALFDPQNKQALLQAEEVVRQNRLSEKLQSLLLATINVSEAEIRDKFIDQNATLNVQYALVDLNLFPDSTIKVTDDELKEHYNKNLDDHKTVEQRKLRYVLFPNTASEEDSNRIKSSLENVAEMLKDDTSSFKEFVDIYSSIPYSKDTISLSTLPDDAGNLINAAEPGSVIGPVTLNEGIALYKVYGSVPSDEALIRASHILINQFGSDEKNLEEAMKVYDQLNAGVSFEKIAKERSADPGSGAKGGDLGWFGKGAMVPEFEKAAFGGQVGVVQKPVKTSYGYHIIKVTDKSNKKYIVERIVNPIKASATTIDDRYKAAEDFAYVAKDRGFDSEVKTSNYNAMETTAFTKEAYSIPGIGVNKRIVNFAFENDLNDISDPFKVQNGYVVVQISEVIKEGVKPFDEVKNLIRPTVIREKKMDKAAKMAEDLKNKVKGDLSKAASVNSKVTVNITGSFKPMSPIPFVGRDNAFIAKALEMDLNKISEPVKGFRGYYLIKVLERSKFDSTAYETQRISIRDNILQEKKNSYLNQWITGLKDQAEIVDNRHIFYGQ